MAVVPRASRQINAAPIPGARMTAAETDISAGVGLERARGSKFETVAGVAAQGARLATATLSDVVAQERENANETAMLKASNALAKWKTERLYDPDKGALTLKGEAAMPLPEQITEEFNKTADEIALGLATPQQKLAFEKMRAQSFAQVDLEVRRHVFGEMQEFRAGELKAAINNGVDEAVRAANDPALVGLSMAKVEQQMRTNLPKLGVGKDALEEQVRTVKSNIHVGVINQLLSQDKDKDASDYFHEVKGQIAADKVDDVTKALEEGSLRGQAQKTSDDIVAAGGTLKEQLAKARALDDPKLREQVEQRLEHQSIIDERIKKESEEQSMRDGYDIIDRTGTTSKIPPDVWTSYTGATRSAMRSYAEQKARGIPIKTDLPTYYGLMREAMNSPETFANTNLLEKRHLLDEGEFKQLTGLQLSIKSGDRVKADKDIADFRTSSSVVDDALVGLGIDPNANVTKDPAGAQAVSNLRRMVDARVSDLQSVTGKKADSKDVQTIVDQLLASSVNVPGTWGGMFTSAPFYDTKKNLVELTYDDIPADMRKQAEDALRKVGRPVTNATVLNLYLESVARGHVK